MLVISEATHVVTKIATLYLLTYGTTMISAYPRLYINIYMLGAHMDQTFDQANVPLTS
jgi:hypothetical protein